MLEKSLLKDDESVLRFLTTLDLPELADVSLAAEWFDQTLQIITPSEIARGLPHFIDINSELAAYADQLMRTYHLGISGILIERMTLEGICWQGQSQRSPFHYRRARKLPA